MQADGPIPTGTIAFLFTDIAGSTRLWEQMPQAMGQALAQHDAILQRSVADARGRVVKTTGDGLMAVFPTVGDAVRSCLDAQQALGAAAWGETGALRVRMAIHAGDAERRGDDYFGPTVNRTARLMAAGHGGQVLLSAAAAALAGDGLPDGAGLRDLGEYRLKDLGRPERVFQLLHPGLADGFPALATLDHGAGGLPAQAGTFVGRRTELAEVERLLADPAIRILTVTGPGGAGKTSLAIRAASEAMPAFRDGVSFVDLAAARDADEVLTAIGRVIGASEAPGRPLREDIIDRLGDRQVLLVLDNFEQVTDAAGIASELLAGCPGLRLLVTSREPLHVRAEHLLPVGPMELPPAGRRHIPLDELARYEAVELLVDRARAVRPDFALTDEGAAAVAEICRRLDGLPLAIELAAARLRLFSPETLRDRLGGALDLLRSPTRDLPERQQTLRGTIDWSYQLLDPAEQRVLEALAVFADADIMAVEAVAAEGLADARIDVLDALGSLVDKSLVRQVDAGAGEPRLVMLRTIREYAAERLDERPDGAAVRRAHAVHYAELAERFRRDLGGPRRDQVVDALARDAENLRIAWRYWIGEHDLGQLTRLADSLLILNEAKGWYRDTIEITTGLLAALDHAGDSPDLAGREFALRMSLARALMATTGYTPAVEAAMARALEVAESRQEQQREFTVLRGMANLYVLQARFEPGLQFGERILAIAEAQGDVNMRIDGELVAGTALIFTGRLQQGFDRLETAIGLFDAAPARAVGVRLGNEPRVACLTTTGFCLWLLGFPDRAVARTDAGIELARRLDHPWTLAFATFHSGLLHLWRREEATVLDRALRLIEIADEFDFPIWSAIGSCLLGIAQTALGQVDTGLARVREGMASYQGIVAPPVFWPMLLSVDAGASLRAGRPGDGLEPITTAIELMGGTTSPGVLVPELLLLQGDLRAALDGMEADGAVEAHGAALEAARRVGTRMSEVRALTRLGRVALGVERRQRLAELAAALDGLTEGEGTLDVTEARELLAAG